MTTTLPDTPHNDYSYCMPPCPLIFQPIFRAKVWGARHLATLLDKKLPPDQTIGESLECSDLPNAQSVVARGPAKDRNLHELVEEWGVDLLGRATAIDGRFPLLIKFIDAAAPLSIQVHPDQAALDRLGLRDTVKQEAWHVLHAERGASIYRGLRPGVTLEQLRDCSSSQPDRIPELLQTLAVEPGDTYYLPAGTVHALGPGIVVAEVQTPSDVTFRLYDWNRDRPAGDQGMHIDQSLASIRTDQNFADAEKRSHVTSVFTTVTRLLTCPRFIIEKVRFVESIEQEIPYAEPVVWIVLDGRGEIFFEPAGRETFSKGDVVLLPAGLKSGRLKTLSPCAWLEVTIPAASDLSDYTHPHAAAVRENGATGTIPLNIQAKRNP